MQATASAVNAAATSRIDGPSLSHRTQAQKPNNFSGHKREDVSEFAFSMQNFLEVTNEPRANWIKTASTYLKHSAGSWYRLRNNRLAAAHTADTWDDFIKDLKDTYEPVNLQQVTRDRLDALYQTHTVNDYNNEFTKLVLQINDITETEKVDRYIRHLKPETRCQVRMKEPKTLYEAMRIASTFDTLKYNNSGRFGPRYQYPARHYDGPTPMDLGAVQGYYQQPRSPYSNSYDRRQNSRPQNSYNSAPPPPRNGFNQNSRSFNGRPPNQNSFGGNRGSPPNNNRTNSQSWRSGNGQPRRRN